MRKRFYVKLTNVPAEFKSSWTTGWILFDEDSQDEPVAIAFYRDKAKAERSAEFLNLWNEGFVDAGLTGNLPE